MLIDIKLDSDFSDKLESLKSAHGDALAKLNGFSDSHLNHTDFIDSFVSNDTVADTSVDPSANVNKSDMPTLLGELPKSHKKLLSYNKIYYELKKAYGKEIADEWLERDYDGHLYMHDSASASFVSYCFAYDLTDLAEKGLYFLKSGTFNPQPPQHLETFVDFVKEFISFACNRTSGAVGLPNLIPYMFYFWKKDYDGGYCTHDPEYFAKQHIQRFIYSVNQPYTRDGIQSAFTNTSIFDHNYFEALFGGSMFPDGTFMIDFEEEIMDFQKMFCEVMSDIRASNMMTFPVNTISLLYQDGEFVDEDFARWAIEHNRKWNDSNLFVDDTVNSLSNCCRLKSDVSSLGLTDDDEARERKALEGMYESYTGRLSFEAYCDTVKSNKAGMDEVRERKRAIMKQQNKERYQGLGWMNSIGGTALSVGSTKVSTVNLARIALESETEDEFVQSVYDYTMLDCKALHIVRHIIKRNVEKGLLPNFTYKLVDFEHLYNTVGFIGVYESLKRFGCVDYDEFGNAFYTEDGEALGERIFDAIHAATTEFCESIGNDYQINCEQSPAENAADKLMRKDRFFYPDTVVDDLPLYGNQFMPLGIKATLDERVRVQSMFDAFCNGGSILHVNIDAPFDSFDKAWDVAHRIADAGVTYFAFNPRIQACESNHGFYGTKCPTCGGDVATEFTRVVGFFTPVNTWSKARKDEYSMRQWAGINE